MLTNKFYLEGLQIADEESVSNSAQRAAAEDRNLFSCQTGASG